MAVDAGTTSIQYGAAGYYSAPATKVNGDIDVVHCDAASNLLVAPPGIQPIINSAWRLTNAAAVNNAATATKAAGAAGVKHCCAKLSVSLWQDNTGTVSGAAGYTVAVRDGAAGVGTVIWSMTFSFPLATNGLSINLEFTPMVIGTAATAMTVEITSTALAHTGSTVNASGFDCL